MKEYFNCFIGIPLDYQYKYETEEVQKSMQKYLPSASIVEPHNMHITLYYLGQQTESNLEQIANILYEEKNLVGREEIKIGQKGIFTRKYESQNNPHVDPYVIYLKVTHTEKLSEFRKRLGELLDPYNKDENRAFIPHLTLARLKTPESKKQYIESEDQIDDLLKNVNWDYKLKEFFIYGKPNLNSSKFQDTLFRISLI